MRRERAAVTMVFILTGFALALAIWQTISPFVPHAFWGASFAPDSGRVHRVYPEELPPGATIKRGDRVTERPDGNPLRGYILHVPYAGDTVHVQTAAGIEAMTASSHRYPLRDAIVEAFRQVTCGLVIAFAALLFARRPGVMSFAFWISSIYGLRGGDLDFSLDYLPRTIGFGISLFFFGLNYAGFALISFALRFPAGVVSPGWRWLDRTVWVALGLAFVFELFAELQFYAGTWPGGNNDIYASALPTVLATIVFIVKQIRAEPLLRSRLAWATAAFVSAAVFRAAALSPAFASGATIDWRLLSAFGSLCLLLAMYPVLRHRLFDIGFVVNRAALYSTLTVAAFGTLAAVNWVAQHFVTDRLAFVLQPIAAIAIGLGYFRVRSWAQRAIERVLFRERFAAEAYLETVIRTLPFSEQAQTVDDALVAQAKHTLGLRSSALFRAADSGFMRALAHGWEDAQLDHIGPDDIVVRCIRGGDVLAQLPALRWTPGSLPPPPNEPVLALGIVRRGIVTALVLYGRHDNGTELEPEELQLLRRLGEAAAVAYETADVFMLREENSALRRRMELFEAGAVPADLKAV